ncbi:adenylate/guanylate cyclase domain-containing protein [Nocardioides sp. CER19]|uniref:adenylate/guanylate cyclase domain-containing protein n=1 Tax=Nocardioides sp. CER19 TaxID=3038538 RepID=UPI00244B023C|nr:adenylate/guanylate cyclase domain-containing protein [Nocardioides sp. CER19]MDH2415077.1 adenylate/guanylate cyclase domain-containing protein [Nocardioides sp. CER19]
MPESTPEGVRYTASEVAERTGVSLDQAKKLWRALGFPEAGGEAFYTEDDLAALTTLTDILATGIIDFDLAVNLTRGVGLTMARLSDWEVSAMVHHLETLGRLDDRPALTEVAGAVTEEFNKRFEGLLTYAWRRHMSAALARLDASEADDLGTTQVTVGFADIVSFTALSNTLTQEKIGDLVELFESRCADVIAVQQGRVIKSLGDSVLFVNDDPIRAYDTAEGIINVIGRDPRMPDVRLGLATGSVVTRLGDVFGPPVNMAARLTAVARRNRIIVDETTAARLPADQFETRRLPARPVRGFGIVEPVAVRRH